MSILVFVETSEGKVKKSSAEAVAYAKAMGDDVVAIAIGEAEEESLKKLGRFGASKVLHADDSNLNQRVIQAYTSVIAQALEHTSSNMLVLSKSSLGDPVAARLAIRTGAAIATNVVELPDTSSGFKVKRSVYTGNAFEIMELNGEKKIIAIKKNAVDINETEDAAEVEKFSPTTSEDDFKVKITSTEQATGEILLPEAEIVVSGGRGMKGPEHWSLLEDLAEVLGAGMGCSKPVSDMEWRPHREHVGQTGVKISPNLYIAVGISGAIQHLAGVNSSKVIVVINKDPEAPFYSAADYGIVGDAFEVVPKLTEALKAIR